MTMPVPTNNKKKVYSPIPVVKKKKIPVVKKKIPVTIKKA